MKLKPKHLMHFHAVTTVVWLILIIPSVLWWKESIMWIVVMSVWANLAGHFSAWQAARTEVLEHDRINKEDHSLP